MKMKKILCAALASAMALSFAACSGGPSSPASTPVSDAGSTPPSSSDSGAGEVNQVLKFAAKETAYGADVWKEIATAFEAAVPGAKVELTIDKSIEDVIGPAMKSGDYPDVVCVSVGQPAALTETFIKDNNLTDITEVFDMTVPGESAIVKDKLIPGGWLDNNIVKPYKDGQIYLAPMFYSPCGLFYNAGLFEEKGWTLPTTWDEMWELGDKAKAEGIALFTYPTAGYFDAFFYALLNEAGGPDFYNKCMNYEEGIWQTPEAKKAFDIVAKLATYTESTTPANANGDNFKKNQQLILDNKALFMPNGTWIVSEMSEAPRAEGFDWGMMSLPAIEQGGDRYSHTFIEQLWVPKAAGNPELAKQFVAFMYSDEAAEIFAKVDAVQPVKGMSDNLSKDNKLFYTIYDNGAKASLGAFAATDPVEGVSIADSAFETVNSLVSGNKTEEQWIQAITEASDALRGALK